MFGLLSAGVMLVPIVAAATMWVKSRGLEYILVHYRWIFVILFLMPASLVYDVYYAIRNQIIFKLNSAPHKHDEKVKDVQRQVRQWNADGRPNKMCTARPGWMAVSLREGVYKHTLRNISVNLVDVLDIDPVRKIVRVEPLVSMGQITATLNPLGWTLPIVPELDDLTVGGLVMGVGIETSSHKYGLMQHIVESMELVLSDGSLVTCSKTENPELFYALPWSYGTLGFLVSVEFRIIPARKYVELQYYPVHSRDELVKVFRSLSEDNSNEFVEGLAYSGSQAVVMAGRMTDQCIQGKVNAIGNYYKPWFFKHVEGFLSYPSQSTDSTSPRAPVAVEYIPLRHYYHRHTRSIFWQLQDIIPFGNNPLFRYVFGWMVPPKISLLKRTQGETIKRMYEKYQMIQDMLLPIDVFSDALKFFDNNIKLYPLWLCPFTLPDNPGFLKSRPPSSDGKTALYVDIGAYGAPRVPNYDSYETTRRLERYVAENEGFQMLYADSFLTREEFRSMFDHTLYDRMRQKLDCEKAFPEIYDKVNRKARA